MKTNYHVHSKWCDGANTVREMIEGAIGKGFDEIGFSSHAMLPENELDWVLTPGGKIEAYAKEVRELAAEYADRIRVLCGVEADYVKGGASPDRSVYVVINPDYIIGSVHFVNDSEGCKLAIDESVECLGNAIRNHFGGSSRKMIEAYFEAQREMVSTCDFDIVGHPDLVRKFNVKYPYFDESASWYRDQLVLTADAIAASGKLVEVNTGAISRGWLDDVYPSTEFRKLLRDRGVHFILSGDSHSLAAIDCAFDRFATLADMECLQSR